MNRRSISGNNTEQVLQSQITDLQSNIVVMGTNVAVGPDVFTQLTTGYENTAVGYGTSSGSYSLKTGSGNVMVGYNSGGGCTMGSNNMFLKANTNCTAGYVINSIALGEGENITKENQLMVASNVNFFNMAGLLASTGTGKGTILEFDLAGNVLPTAGTYKTVASIDTAIAAVNAPNFFWFTNPTLSGTEDNFTPIPWGTINYGNPANQDTTSGMWTCYRTMAVYLLYLL